MHENKAIKTVAKGAGIVFIGLFISKLLGYLYRMVVARIGPEQYGLLSIGIAVVSIVSFFPLLGLDLGVLRYVAFYKGKEDAAKIKGVILSALKISVPLSLLFLILVLIFSKTISINIFHNEELVNIVRILVLFMPFLVVSNILLSAIKSFQRVEYLVLIKNISENLTKVVLTVIFMYIGYELIGAAVAYVLAIFVTFILSYYFLKKEVFNIFSNIMPKFITKELVGYSWPLMFSLLLTQIIVWTDLLMLGYFRDAFDVGIYNAALPTAALMNVIPGALIVLFVPLMTEMYAKNNRLGLEQLFKTVAKWIFFSNIIVFFIMNLFAIDILRILFGHVYTKGASALVILSVGYFVYYNLSIASIQMLEVVKKTKYVMINSLVAALLNILLNYILIPKHGMLGGAIATTVCFSVYGLLAGIEIFVMTKLIPLKLSYLKSGASGFIAAVITYYIAKAFTVDFWAFIILSGIFVGIYLFLIIIMKCLDREDIEILKAIERKSGVRLGILRNVVKKFI